ncbi:NAD-dependent epimerase/dehydratase family protein [candidate division WOR-3 bacterium]|nr:NAD-dependent epimerase/dehydratase family protein [candidate division WOR-3 bacterium]
MKNILVTGAVGQIGSELVEKLREKYGNNSVIAAGHKTQPTEGMRKAGPFEFVNILDKEALEKFIVKYNIGTFYHMSSILSAVGEQKPQLAFQVNILGLYNVLEIGLKYKLEKIIIPSSIAVFGPETPRDNTPNETILLPTTMYGITKVTGELLGNYYFRRFGLDVRGLRLPGIISYKTLPGGGTTDYAVEIYYEAIKHKKYTCFVRENTVLPMMYMPDCVKAIIDLADVPLSKLKHHTDFNVTAMSFSAGELADSIKEIIPEFTCEYKPDFRQAIADSWPKSLDDSAAREEWGWKPEYDLPKMTKDMIEKLSPKLKA